MSKVSEEDGSVPGDLAGDGGGHSLILTVVERFRKDISVSRSSILPATSVLARRYGVSSTTLRKAAEILRRENLLAIHRGRRMRIVEKQSKRTAAERPLSAPDSATRTMDCMRSRIEDGTYKAGRALPKIGFFARTLRVSDHTVSAALRRLAAEGVVGKSGKSWIVGKTGSLTPHVSTRYPSAVLIVLRHPGEWARMAQSKRTARFCLSFNEEMERFGVRPVPLLLDPSPRSPMPPSQYRERIRAARRDLGSQCLGALLTGSSESIGSIEEWGELFRGVGYPAVWFDRTNEPRYRPRKLENIVRCYFSEENATAEAVRFLHGLGHRSIGLVNHRYSHAPRWSWVEHRLELIRDAASNVDPPMRVVSRPNLRDLMLNTPEAHFLEPMRSLYRRRSDLRLCLDHILKQMPRFKEHLRHFGIAVGGDPMMQLIRVAKLLAIKGAHPIEIDPAHERLLYLTPLLLEFLVVNKVSALIAPCDEDAVIIYSWLEASGYRMPHKLSLVSFDNYPETYFHPIDTVDFGFGHLGYCAFHSLLRDVHLRRDPFGGIGSQPTVVRRGSSGAPPGDRNGVAPKHSA